VGQAVQKLHLTPRQLLSLRDFLGGFNRSMQVDASEGGLFVLRDTASMVYAGEFSLKLRSDGALQVDRIAGPATLDFSHAVPLPLRLLAKPRAQAMAVLSGSQMLTPPVVAGEAENPVAAAVALPAPQLAGLKLTANDAAATVVQSRAVFFPDGSGIVASVRAPLGATAAPMRLTSRYYAAVRSDGAHAWRDAVLEFNSDVQLGLPALEARYSCAGPDVCSTPRSSLPQQLAFHMIRWQHDLIPAIPPTLLAQLAPAPVTPAPAIATAPDDAAPIQDTPPPPDSPPTSAPQL
jgi:hypothetical protein